MISDMNVIIAAMFFIAVIIVFGGGLLWLLAQMIIDSFASWYSEQIGLTYHIRCELIENEQGIECLQRTWDWKYNCNLTDFNKKFIDWYIDKTMH